MTTRRWGRRRITLAKTRRAIDAVMALVQTGTWPDVDADDRATIDRALAALTSLRYGAPV